MKNDFYKRLIEESPIGYAYHKIICKDDGIPCDYEFIEVNSAFEVFTGLKGSEIIGNQITKVLPDIRKSKFDWIKFYGEIAINGGKREFEQFSEPLKKWYRVNVFSPEKYYFITYFSDVSEWKMHAIKMGNLQETLEETEIKYETVADYAYDWETWEDEQGKLRYISPACERTSGYTADEFLKNKSLLSSLIVEEDKVRWEKHKHDAGTEKGIQCEQFRIKNKNGNIVWIEHTCRPVIDENGKYLGYRVNNRDITDRKQAEETLQSNQRQLADIIEFLPDATLAIDKERRVIIWNRAIEKMTGIPASQMIGKGNYAYTVPFYGKEQPQLMDLVFFDDKEVATRYPGLTREGDTIIAETFCPALYNKKGAWVYLKVSPLHDQSGNTIGAIESIRDISEQKLAEAGLQSKTTFLEAQTNASLDGILVIDENNTRILANRRLFELFHVPQHIIEDKDDSLLLKHNAGLVKNPEQFLKKIEYLNKHVNETSRDEMELKSGMILDRHSAPVLDKEGKYYGRIWTFHDVTERRKAEKLLKESEERFRTIFEQTSVGICLISLDKSIISANQKACEILGYSTEEICKFSYDDLVCPEYRDYDHEVYLQLYDGTIKTLTLENKIIKKDGTIIWADLSVSLLRDAENSPSYIITTVQDITDKKLAQIALVISEDRLKRTQTIAHVGGWELDIASKQIWLSEEGLKICGLEQDSSYIFEEKLRNTVVKEDLLKLDQTLNMMIGKKEEFYIQFRMARVNDGLERDMHSSAILERDQNGNPIKIVGVIQDITERKRAEKMLLDNEEKYKNLSLEYQQKQLLLKSLINSIPDLIFYKDKESVYLGCNKAFEAFSGMEENKLIGLTDFDLVDDESATLFRSMDVEMMKQVSPRTNEEVVSYPDGRKRLLETLKTPYYDPQGNVVGLIGISRDITERKKREEDILFLSYHDVLTGVYNRAYFEEARKNFDTESQLPLSVIIGDINGLKLLNDAFGHAEGDKILIEMAKILKKCSRSADVVARTGGDEFCILMPQTDGKGAQEMADRIKKACEEYANKKDKETYYASISLGHATKSKMEEPFDKILKAAEEFMYRRKLFEYKSLHSSILSSIKTTMFEKSNETEEHAERLAKLSKKLGKALALDDEKLTELELLSTLHDIGKISIDLNLLTKPGKLSEEDWTEIKKHPEVGYRIAQATSELSHIAEYILCHHEHWDGKGYPQGLSGVQIPLLSRILAIIDSYDAMTQDRSYRRAMSKEEAITEIKIHAGSQFDPEIAKIFVDLVLDSSGSKEQNDRQSE